MNNFTQAISRQVARKSLQLQKNSPTVLLGVGIAGMITSSALACRATLRLEEVLETTRDDLETAKSLEHYQYTEQDRSRDISIIYVRTGARVVRLYGPAIVVGVASVAALTRSHHILNQRNAALTAAYAALERGFNEYRERVIEKYGEDEDRNLRYGTQEVEVLNEETGKKKKELRAAPGMPSIYARIFDWNSSSWSGEPAYNFIFLKCQQDYANDMLRARGHIFLNDIYDMLGLERSTAGAVVGWILNNQDGTGDNFVDFGIFDLEAKVKEFMIGDENEILLDFNVDGVVYDKLDQIKELTSGD